jgi:probable HAF family extracellular repeat protein
MSQRSLSGACALAFLLATPFAHGETTASAYEFSALPSLGGHQAAAYGINNRGEVVGSATSAHTQYAYPVMWTPRGEIHQLDALGGTASGVNDNGTIVGTRSSAGFGALPVYWRDGVEYQLDSIAGNATAINAHGTMVGEDDTNATYYTKTKAIHYGGLLYSYFDGGLAINDHDDVVGWSMDFNGVPIPYEVPHLHLHGQTTFQLPSLGQAGVATGINGHGLIVGQNWTYDSHNHIVLAYAVQWIQLQPVRLPWDSDFSSANAVNADGRIVGWGQAADGVSHAVLWKEGETIDLNRFIDPSWRRHGWVMTSANAINDRGWIVGQMAGPSGKTLAWVLRPAGTH